MIFRTFTLRIIGPETFLPEGESSEVLLREEKTVARILSGRVLGDAEDVVNDALPEGWSASIEEWDA